MTTGGRILVATDAAVLAVDPRRGTAEEGGGLGPALPTCLAADPFTPSGGWCGTKGGGVFRTDDGGGTWRRSGLDGEHLMSLAASPAEPGLLWAGTEPSALWRSADGGGSWERARGLLEMPSSSTWAFPPRPDTHHVRWIACHPADAGRLWLAIEAGALVTTPDGGRSWRDRVPGGPYDTHELAVHPERPEHLRVAAGDGYYESADGGATWASPGEGLEVRYLRSVAVDPGDPDVVVVSASSRARSAYVAGRSDGRLYRREGGGAWERITNGWTEPPVTIAPLLRSGAEPGELWAADERGVHRSGDGGRSWALSAAFRATPTNLRGMALLVSGQAR